MTVHQETIEVSLEAEFDAADLSDDVERIVAASGIREGTVTLFNAGSTAAITTIEYESGCLTDLRRALESIAPASGDYEHNLRWGDGNGFSHLRAALLGPSITVPVIDGRPGCSTWQQPIVINFDNRARTRRVVVTVVGVR
jgi:secondary thiamine-phosphate synthase enzyme